MKLRDLKPGDKFTITSTPVMRVSHLFTPILVRTTGANLAARVRWALKLRRELDTLRLEHHPK